MTCVCDCPVIRIVASAIHFAFHFNPETSVLLLEHRHVEPQQMYPVAELHLARSSLTGFARCARMHEVVPLSGDRLAWHAGRWGQRLSA